MHGTEPKYREPEERQELQAVRRRDLGEDERRGEVLKVDQKPREAIRRYERLALKHKALVTIASTIIHLRYRVGRRILYRAPATKKAVGVRHLA
jgi:hypothetical protein